MPVTKEKIRSHAKKQRRGSSMQRTNGRELNEEQLIELLKAYQTIGKVLEKLVGRERLYRSQFLRGLESALADVAAGRTKEIKSFEDFAS
jgi:hypothetical protein